ncbi:hypothetical protein, partial [Klebsiella quasipneumoniae]|uniref:hypothetical protein n=1 Tax=Klebsiella quasipneumoniae TaxID=1463165 RepID=UPI0019D44498
CKHDHLSNQKLQINYKVTTGLPQIRSLNHSYIAPLPERAENGFSGCAGNASRSHNKLRTRSPFSAGFGASFETSGLNSGRKFSPVSQVHGYAWG